MSKDFKQDNPAMMWLQGGASESVPSSTETVPEEKPQAPVEKERKTIRKFLLFRPSFIAEIDRICERENRSFNGVVECALREYMQNHGGADND